MKIAIHLIGLTIALTVIPLPQLNARILSVASQSFPQVAEFNTIQEAHDAAHDGDTIYLYPSTIAYKGAIINKRILLIGAGFKKLNDFADCSKISGNDTITFQAGSDGSLISSIKGTFSIYVKANNIVISKCILNKVHIEKDYSNITIINSKIITGDGAIKISENSYANIFNNVISGSTSIYIDKNAYALIKNNIIYGETYAIQGYSASLINNILLSKIYGYTLTIDSNIENSPNLNQWDNRDGWFVDYISGNYHLKEDSPGKNAGTDGKDLGIYGGEFPFDDDGAPSLPTIYSLKTPPTASKSEGLNIEIKAKSN